MTQNIFTFIYSQEHFAFYELLHLHRDSCIHLIKAKAVFQ